MDLDERETVNVRFEVPILQAVLAKQTSHSHRALVENRNGLIAAAMVTHADGYAERDAALLMLNQKQGRSRRITLGRTRLTIARTLCALCEN